jgi:hypothetical protein
MNQMRRAGGSMIIERITQVVITVFALATFALLFALGLFGVESISVMLIWDAMVAGFVMFWLTELLVELQRSELLSLDRFLHLPVPLSGVFVINYLGSLLSPSAILFLSGALGFSIGLLLSHGWRMLFVFPLLLAFTLAVTAITYQFRGWLAALMVNKRRRRTILTLVTFGFVFMFQIPNFIGMASGRWFNGEENSAFRQETRQLNRQLRNNEIDRTEFEREMDAVYKKHGRTRGGFIAESGEALTTLNKVVPLGWLPYGARRSAEGNAFPAILGTMALSLVGALSLRRSFRTTIKLYTGATAPPRTRKVSLPKLPQTRDAAISGDLNTLTLLERKLPWVSEHTSAVAVAAFRSLLRAPEAKMMLLSPLILAVVFGSFVLRQDPAGLPELAKPLAATGAIAMVLAMMFQLSGNQFGFDRSGFRAFVLAPVPRRYILLGKNLALMPMALGMGSILVLAIQIFMPMRIDHLLAVLLQMTAMYLLFCIPTNFLSILAPTAIASGSLKPVKPKGMSILLGIAFFFLSPIALTPTLLPLGVEFLLEWADWMSWFPAYFILTLLELAVVLLVYDKFIELQGRLLQSREQRILEIVTVKVE